MYSVIGTFRHSFQFPHRAQTQFGFRGHGTAEAATYPATSTTMAAASSPSPASPSATPVSTCARPPTDLTSASSRHKSRWWRRARAAAEEEDEEEELKGVRVKFPIQSVPRC